MRKKLLPAILVASLLFGFFACKPDTEPDKPGSEIVKPEPEPEPNPEPEPEPEPTPEPVVETVVYYDNLDKVKATDNSHIPSIRLRIRMHIFSLIHQSVFHHRKSNEFFISR